MFVPAVPLSAGGVKIAHSGEAVMRGPPASSHWPNNLIVCPNAKYTCSG